MVMRLPCTKLALKIPDSENSLQEGTFVTLNFCGELLGGGRVTEFTSQVYCLPQ